MTVVSVKTQRICTQALRSEAFRSIHVLRQSKPPTALKVELIPETHAGGSHSLSAAVDLCKETGGIREADLQQRQQSARLLALKSSKKCSVLNR